jgi:hypothetical protein
MKRPWRQPEVPQRTVAKLRNGSSKNGLETCIARVRHHTGKLARQCPPQGSCGAATLDGIAVWECWIKRQLWAESWREILARNRGARFWNGILGWQFWIESWLGNVDGIVVWECWMESWCENFDGIAAGDLTRNRGVGKNANHGQATE